MMGGVGRIDLALYRDWGRAALNKIIKLPVP